MESLHVVTAEYENTGGGCYTYFGQLNNGQYFAFGLNVFSIFDSDFGYLLSEDGFKETDGDWSDWIEKHLIEEYTYPKKFDSIPAELVKPERLIKETFEILKSNYSGGEIWNELMRNELDPYI